MGSMITRHLRDLGDVHVCEENGSEKTAGNQTLTKSATESQIYIHRSSSDSCLATPSENTPIRVLDLDPRSPTADIVRTPIEVSSKYTRRFFQDSPMTNVLQSRRSYLETDLDTLSTSETLQMPENNKEKPCTSLPPGLSSAHLMKLQFLGIDPRSPSSDVIRTPIQIGKSNQREDNLFDDSLSVGSLSSRDILNNSVCSSEFIRDCSDPSAFVSEIEDLSDEENEDCGPDVAQEKLTKLTDVIPKEELQPCTSAREKAEEQVKLANKLFIFQENQQKTVLDEKPFPATPEGNKKPTGNRSRTPLTPICNRNRTPNSILRAKQSQTIEKEILTKAKIYSTDESVQTPPKIRSVGKSSKGNIVNSRRGMSNNENAPISGAMKSTLGGIQWDQDSSVII